MGHADYPSQQSDVGLPFKTFLRALLKHSAGSNPRNNRSRIFMILLLAISTRILSQHFLYAASIKRKICSIDASLDLCNHTSNPAYFFYKRKQSWIRTNEFYQKYEQIPLDSLSVNKQMVESFSLEWKSKHENINILKSNKPFMNYSNV